MYPDASKHFLADVYAGDGGHHPITRVPASVEGFGLLGGSPKLTIIRNFPSLRTYRNRTQSVYSALLADGSNSLCKAVFNSGLTTRVKESGMFPGCTLELSRFDVIWHQENEDMIKKAVFFIKDFEFKEGPKVSILDDEEEEWSHVTPDEHCRVRYHSPVLNSVWTHSLIQHCEIKIRPNQDDFAPCHVTLVGGVNEERCFPNNFLLSLLSLGRGATTQLPHRSSRAQEPHTQGESKRKTIILIVFYSTTIVCIMVAPDTSSKCNHGVPQFDDDDEKQLYNEGFKDLLKNVNKYMEKGS